MDEGIENGELKNVECKKPYSEFYILNSLFFILNPPMIQTHPTVEEVKRLAFKLSPQDLLILLTDIQTQLHAKVADRPDDLDEQTWLQAIATNPSFAFLHDPEEDIYTLEDGKPVSREG